MITSARIQDLPVLADLFDQYRTFYRKESDLMAATAFLRERLTTGDSSIFLAWAGEEAAGFVQLYPIFSSTKMQRLWLLNDLYVAPAYRGKGHSLALIERAKALARATQASGLLLETEVSNTIGNQLYPRAGFSKNTTSHFYEWNCK